MLSKPLIFICCFLIGTDALAIRGDGSRVQNFRNNHPNYYKSGSSIIIQQNYGYNPYVNNGYGFNPSDSYSYQDRSGMMIYYTTDFNGNTVYFRYGDDGKILYVDPLQHPR